MEPMQEAADQAMPRERNALAALEEAVWEARRDHTGAAVAALEAAIVRLEA